MTDKELIAALEKCLNRFPPTSVCEHDGKNGALLNSMRSIIFHYKVKHPEIFTEKDTYV